MNPILIGLKGLGAPRLAALGAVAFAMMGLLTVLALHRTSDQMVLLYGELDMREASQIADLLDRQKLTYQVGSGGTQIFVPTEQIAKDRLLLAKEGLPSGGSIGYEIFDRGDNLTASQFQQSMNQSRALEGELSRTIRSIQGVKAARVHLVMPKREPFARDRQDAQASVQLTMAGVARLDNEGTRAILNLVAAAVPGLRPQSIAVTDTRGNLLARAGEAIGPAGAAIGNDEQRHASELRIARAIEEMLERSLGQGHVSAEASVDFDYEQIHETQERYDPDGQVVRSTQNVNNTSKTSEVAATVSVQNNLPNADSGTNGAGTQEQRQEETTNYEIAKTVRTVVRDQPKIARISLAVMIDGIVSKGSDGVVGWKERPADEIDRISRLVRSAVGYDEKRGDKVDVVSLRFIAGIEATEEVPKGGFLFGLDKSDMIRLGHTTIFGLLALLALLFVLRPMVNRLTLNPDLTLLPAEITEENFVTDNLNKSEIPNDVKHQTMLNAHTSIPTFDRSSVSRQVIGGLAGMSMLEDASLVNIVNVEGKLMASSIRKVADLIDKHPEESLSIMRAWMYQEAA